jgi:hypothetical protein
MQALGDLLSRLVKQSQADNTIKTDGNDAMPKSLGRGIRNDAACMAMPIFAARCNFDIATPVSFRMAFLFEAVR